ncbi:hypothetical protein TNCV_3884501 [Trichonephila clavipes]|nr:hypothetical protein TNCV_3884501 [Trichonephila clavipes]
MLTNFRDSMNCATLLLLKQRIRRIRPERNVLLLHHDNATPQCSVPTQVVMGKLKFTVVPQPPNSPHLAPSDFQFFLKIKGDVGMSTFFNVCRISGSHAQINTQPTRIYLHGRKEEIDRMIEQMLCCY